MQELLDAELDTPITFRLPNGVYRTSSTICRGQKIGTGGLVMDVLRTDGVWVYVGGGDNIRKVPTANVVSVRELVSELGAGLRAMHDRIVAEEERIADIVDGVAAEMVEVAGASSLLAKPKKKTKKKKAKKKVGPPPGPKTEGGS